MFSQKSYQKVLVLTFIHINKVVFYRFSQYISNILVLSRYYFILYAIIIYIYIIYIIIYREKKAPRRLRSWVVGDEFRRWAPRRLHSWVVGDEFRRWASRRLRSWVRSHIPADPDRRSQPEPPSVAAQSSS
nr:MAG TPA: hypothetical protein [Caudoviricetes sp.]